MIFVVLIGFFFCRYKEIDHFFEEKYQKKKKLHQQAWDEWKNNLGNMTELDAMYQYMKLARGLAT
jgi:hypothetical protein